MVSVADLHHQRIAAQLTTAAVQGVAVQLGQITGPAGAPNTIEARLAAVWQVYVYFYGRMQDVEALAAELEATRQKPGGDQGQAPGENLSARAAGPGRTPNPSGGQ